MNTTPEIIKNYTNLKKQIQTLCVVTDEYKEAELKLQILQTQLKDYFNSFAGVILNIRLGLGITQSEAAEILEMNQSLLSQYENGYKKPGEDQIKRFAAAYSVSFLFSEESVQVIEHQSQNAP